MILDLLRHGETELGGGLRGSLDDALTATGWAQMRQAVAQAGPWDVVVSSPLQRCALFADELGARLGLPVQREADVRELHFGDWEGRSAAQIMQTEADALGLFWPTPTPSRRRPASRCWRLPSGSWQRSNAWPARMPASACCWSPMAG
jgi:alpha-ribazole phosphatase